MYQLSWTVGALVSVAVTVMGCSVAVADVIQPSCSTESSDQAAAAAFYPSELDELYRDVWGAGATPLRQICARRFSVGADGERVVAAYSNGLECAFRLIDVRGAGRLLAEASLKPGGNDPLIQLEDFDGDGRPEFLFTCVTRANIDTWILRDDGAGRLVIAGPTVQVGSEHLTELSLPIVEDVTGDGIPEVLQPQRSEESDGSLAYKVYGLSGEVPVERTAAFWQRYDRTEGEPDVYKDAFGATEGAHALRIVNSGVTSGFIRLNGKTVVNPSDFKRNSPGFEVEVRLNTLNELTVEVQGKPGSSLSLILLKK